MFGEYESGFQKFRRMLEEELVSSSNSTRRSAEWDRCARDPVYFIDTHCRTYDPRLAVAGLDPNIPFRLFDKQKAFIRWLQERESKHEGGLCEKSRDAGVSFLCAAYALHGWLFRPGFKAGFGSRKLEYVDKLGDMDSIFEKMRFMRRKLPEWMLPRGFKPAVHDCHTKLVNPETGAAITGEGGDEIGRGGRVTIYFVDEAAHLERPHLADASLVATTDVRIDVSTPNGPGNPFAVKRFSLSPERVFTLHWRDDPRKDQAWYDRTLKEKGPTVMAAEYDIDYSASLEGICIPGAWVRAAVELDLYPVGEHGADGLYIMQDRRHHRSVPCKGGLDVAEEGNNLSVFIPRWGPVVGDPVSWGKANTTETAWRARDEGIRHKIDELLYDVVGVGAGVKGTLKTPEKPLPFRTRGVNTGEAPTESVWPDGETSKEKFFNLKAELWWSLRCRFERTYEFVKEGKTHPPEDMISIPNCPQLIQELSFPLYERTERGKIQIEKKDDLRRRGIKSPDFAEALVISEAAYAAKLKEFWIR